MGEGLERLAVNNVIFGGKVTYAGVVKSDVVIYGVPPGFSQYCFKTRGTVPPYCDKVPPYRAYMHLLYMYLLYFQRLNAIKTRLGYVQCTMMRWDTMAVVTHPFRIMVIFI